MSESPLQSRGDSLRYTSLSVCPNRCRCAPGSPLCSAGRQGRALNTGTPQKKAPLTQPEPQWRKEDELNLFLWSLLAFKLLQRGFQRAGAVCCLGLAVSTSSSSAGAISAAVPSAWAQSCLLSRRYWLAS